MKCFEIDLSELIKVTLLNKQNFTCNSQHITRYTSEYILYVIERGKLLLENNGELLELLPGDVYLFDKGDFQKPIKPTECEFYYLHFITGAFSQVELSDREYCDAIKHRRSNFVKADTYGTDSYDYMKVLLKQRIHISDKTILQHIIGIFKNNILSPSNNTPEWRLGVSNTVAQLLMKLEYICFENRDKAYKGKNGSVYDTVERIATYIKAHYKENFGSHDIERDLNINFDYANRIFKKNIGYSIINYRNRLRINIAKTLVIEKTLDDAASEVGFGDRYYFSRCFKKFEGVSPEKYRQRVNDKHSVEW